MSDRTARKSDAGKKIRFITFIYLNYTRTYPTCNDITTVDYNIIIICMITDCPGIQTIANETGRINRMLSKGLIPTQNAR